MNNVLLLLDELGEKVEKIKRKDTELCVALHLCDCIFAYVFSIINNLYFVPVCP